MVDVTGHRFGRLVVMQASAVRLNGRKSWECKCDCGGSKSVVLSSLISGSTKSCGCLADESRKVATRVHGLSNTKEYEVWSSMKSRCMNSKNKHYKDYGGRGIYVCSKWQTSFRDFYSDMGPKPSEDHSLERIDNDKGYFPGNCKWATGFEQANNTRRNHFLVLDGRRLTLSQWAIEIGVDISVIKSRIRYGWSVRRILTETVRPRELLLTVDGKTNTIKEWSRITGLKVGTIQTRFITRGWSAEESIRPLGHAPSI